MVRGWRHNVTEYADANGCLWRRSRDREFRAPGAEDSRFTIIAL
jgi:hypothetical protein